MKIDRRDIIGKTIKRIDFMSVHDRGIEFQHIDQIVFTDGTRVSLTVAEIEDDYVIQGTYMGNNTRRRA